MMLIGMIMDSGANHENGISIYENQFEKNAHRKLYQYGRNVVSVTNFVDGRFWI